ncbi:hypothetical protein JB92DRAFT_2782635 [Gautieria morchelliformis]|nr:hypothetical protein JB92DRAFT_2782635 [Gautieria morchelliformis]
MQRTSTTRLPAALRELIEKEDSHDTRKRRKQAVPRKQARKEGRQQLKQRKAAFFSQARSPELLQSRKRYVDDHQLEPVTKKARVKAQLTASQQPRMALKGVPPSALASQSQRSANEQASQETSRPDLTSSHPGRRPLSNIKAGASHEDNVEDARIAWLEAKLGVAKSNTKKGKSMSFGDGLDDLMIDIDRILPNNAQSSSKSSESGDSEGSDISEFEGFSTTELNEEQGEVTPSTSFQIGDHDETSSIGADDQTPTTPGVDQAQTVTQPLPESRYIPPHIRESPTESSETPLKLVRQLKGLLNRLSEQNMASILATIEDIYRSHRRHDVTSTLTALIVDGISSHSSHLDSFVVLHASLVTCLYKIIGVDFVAHFIQFLMASYERYYQAISGNDLNAIEDEPKGKECLNLAVLLSELYNFQVISCILVYDVIRGLLDTLNEFDVELLLKIARNSGQQLRQDDPSALKDIIQIVHAKMSNKQQETISSRIRFMVETLTNLKNNKVKRAPGHDGRTESVERMKKFMSGLSKNHHVMAHEPLRVSLDDLHSSAKKGKWWLVGSAWGGDPLLDRTLMEDKRSISTDPSVQASDSLLQLARKQGMNTDVRRGIFVVLMSSDDYVDSYERLSQLNLTEVQQREIVRVILHCLGNEKQYNPYYTLIVQELCRTSHSHRVTLQFCLWDFLRDLGEKGVGGAEIIRGLREDDTHMHFDSKKTSPTRRLNVARAYAWWITKGSCSLTILKPVDFTILQKQSRDFFRDFFFQLFISSQVSSPAIASNAEAARYLTGPGKRESLEEIFSKATRISTLTQGLLYFLTTTLRGDCRSDNEQVSETLKWARDVARDTLRIGLDVVASLK